MFRLSALKLTGLFFLTAVLDLYVMPAVTVRGVKPDLWVLFLLFYSFRVDWKKAPVIAFAVGLMKDLFSTRPFGIEILSIGIPMILLSYLIGKVEREDPLIMLASACLFMFLYEFLSISGFFMTSESSMLFGDLFFRGMSFALYTVAAMPVVFYLFENIVTPWRERFYSVWRSRITYEEDL